MNDHAKLIVYFISSKTRHAFDWNSIIVRKLHVEHGECLNDCHPMGCYILFFLTIKHLNTTSS